MNRELGMDRKVPSAAGARAPFLRMVQDADTVPENAAAAGAVLASFAIVDIDPLGKRPSAFLRIVSWPQESGRWAFGVLEEQWPHNQLGQGRPSLTRLWQTPQEFNLESMARDQVDFWSKNKTIGMIRRELLGMREYYEEKATPPVLLADSAQGHDLPFTRPPLKTRQSRKSDIALRQQ